MGWTAEHHGHALTKKAAHHAKAAKPTSKRRKHIAKRQLPSRKKLPKHTTRYMGAAIADKNFLSDLVAEKALSFLGTPYRPGGSSQRGFDCSGLVHYVYSQSGVELPRASYAQARKGAVIGKTELKKGDLVFFRTARRKQAPINHVGIYLGNQQFVHSPAVGGVVRIDRLSDPYWRRTFITARRIVEPNS